jgi:hypothetical protein
MAARGQVKAGVAPLFLVILSLSSFSSDGSEQRKDGRQKSKRKEKE